MRWVLRWRLMPIEGSKGERKFAPVILAGGSGTRFWPRSRKARAKQVLALDGERTMIQQTVDRLAPVAGPADVWVITNDLLDDLIAEQLPEVPREHILSEPAARNTAPACALAAFLLEKSEPETVIGIFPSDHVVKNRARFAEFVRVFAEVYPQCENISIDYAVLEPRSSKGEAGAEIYCLPGDFEWNDLGCWSALHEHAAGCPPEKVSIVNVFDGDDPLCISIDSTGNYVHAPGKVIALVGVSNLVVVQTKDALLITTRERSQDVGKVVAELKNAGRDDLI